MRFVARRDRAHQREHLERGAALAGGVAPEQVVVGEHAVEPRAPRPRPRTASDVATSSRNDGSVSPSFTPGCRAAHASSRASTAAPTTPA